MIIRDYQSEDLPSLEQIYAAQALPYPLPALDRMLVRRVVTDGERIVLAGALKPTADAYLLVDTTWQTPGVRLWALERLHAAMLQATIKTNIQQVHAWIPPQLEKSMGRRLVRDFGWWHTDWPCYVKEVK
jgi:hypothetical protein